MRKLRTQRIGSEKEGDLQNAVDAISLQQFTADPDTCLVSTILNVRKISSNWIPTTTSRKFWLIKLKQAFFLTSPVVLKKKHLNG